MGGHLRLCQFSRLTKALVDSDKKVKTFFYFTEPTISMVELCQNTKNNFF